MGFFDLKTKYNERKKRKAASKEQKKVAKDALDKALEKMKEAERDYLNSIKQNTVGNPDSFNEAVKDYESKREEYMKFKGKVGSMFSRNKSKRSRKAVEKAKKEAQKGASGGGRRRRRGRTQRRSQKRRTQKRRTQRRRTQRRRP